MESGSGRHPARRAVMRGWVAAVFWLLAGGGDGMAQVAAPAPARERETVAVLSPDGQIRVELALRRIEDREAVPCYRVSYRGKLLLDDSSLGLDLAETGPLRGEFRVLKVEETAGDETWTVVAGKSSHARDHWRGAIVSLEEQAEPRRRINVAVRAYDDGVAFRYVLPEQPALTSVTITEEHSQFHLAGDWTAFVLPLDGYAAHYEAKYRIGSVRTITPEAHVGLPLLLQNGQGVYLALTEANLTDYAGMYLSGVARKPGALSSALSPMPNQPQVKVKAAAPHVSPWRVIMIADAPGRLIESNLLLNLNEPCAIEDTTWIRPGKTTFPWWNGYFLEDVEFEPGLNTATAKHYIDFCAEHGIEYHSLDGLGDAWYGGRIRPYEGADITTAIDGLDLPEVLAYAREKGVRLRLWMHWEALREHIDRAFPMYEEWGIEGVMVDFMNRDDQEMVNFIEEVVRKAAKHKLTVTLHGSYKPTGIRRTWPNLLTSEGVRNLEYNKFKSSDGIPPEHEVLVPFTRMLAGPLDFHQGGFRHVRVEEFEPRYVGPAVMGTRARQLASYVIMENPLPMVADSPSVYRGQAGFEFIAKVPTVWDETRVLHGTPGKQLVIARRRGQQWYVGSMTDRQAREIAIKLDFLGPGEFTAEVYADDLDPSQPPSSLVLETRAATARDVMTLRLAPAGGHAIRFRPAR